MMPTTTANASKSSFDAIFDGIPMSVNQSRLATTSGDSFGSNLSNEDKSSSAPELDYLVEDLGLMHGNGSTLTGSAERFRHVNASVNSGVNGHGNGHVIGYGQGQPLSTFSPVGMPRVGLSATSHDQGSHGMDKENSGDLATDVAFHSGSAFDGSSGTIQQHGHVDYYDSGPNGLNGSSTHLHGPEEDQHQPYYNHRDQRVVPSARGGDDAQRLSRAATNGSDSGSGVAGGSSSRSGSKRSNPATSNGGGGGSRGGRGDRGGGRVGGRGGGKGGGATKKGSKVATEKDSRPAKRVKADKLSASDSGDSRGSDDDEGDEDELDSKDLDTEEAKIMYRRMRNRKHAAATRQRKKESMVQMLEELAQLRKDKLKWADAEHQEHRQQLRRSTWIDCTHRAFALQTNYNSNPAAWAACFDPNVVLVQPVTPYRSSDTSRLDQTTSRCELIGIPALMKNAASLVVALGALANRGLHNERPETPGTGGLRLPCDVALSYDLSTGQAGSEVVGYRDDGLMCSFKILSRNLMRLGLLQEVAKCGTVSVRFNGVDLIDRIEYSFDVMSVWRQMQNAVASRDPVLVPTSLATANRVSRMPHIVANACYPWRIIDANPAFSQLTGYMREEAIGSTLGLLLEGDATDISVVEAFMDDCLSLRSSSMEVSHYRKDGVPMRNFVQFFPLTPPTPQVAGHPQSEVVPCLFVVRPTSGWFTDA